MYFGIFVYQNSNFSKKKTKNYIKIQGIFIKKLSWLISYSDIHFFKKAQEKILTDDAQVVAPILYSGQVNFQVSFFCIACFKYCLGNKKCPRCKLPICEKSCAKNKTHIEDCPVLRDVFDDEDDPHEISTVEERFQHLGKFSI